MAKEDRTETSIHGRMRPGSLISAGKVKEERKGVSFASVRPPQYHRRLAGTDMTAGRSRCNTGIGMNGCNVFGKSLECMQQTAVKCRACRTSITVENGTGIEMTEVPVGRRSGTQDTLCRGSAALVSKAFLVKVHWNDGGREMSREGRAS